MTLVGENKNLGISALAINEDTLAAARTHNEDLWEMAVTSVFMLLLSPEQLTSRSLDHLLQKKAFSERIAALGLDEMHLVMDWGNSGFREAFRQIGLVLACLPRSTTFIGATATLPRHQKSPLVSILGLKPGTFFSIDVQISALMCVLSFAFFGMALRFSRS